MELITYQLDSDGYKGMDRKTAKAINLSMKKMDPIDNNKLKLNRLLTHAGVEEL